MVFATSVLRKGTFKEHTLFERPCLRCHRRKELWQYIQEYIGRHPPPVPTTSLHDYTIRCGSTRDLFIHDTWCPRNPLLDFCSPVSYAPDLLRLWLSERIRSKWPACALAPGWLLRIDTRLRVSTRSLTIEPESSGYRLPLFCPWVQETHSKAILTAESVQWKNLLKHLNAGREENAKDLFDFRTFKSFVLAYPPPPPNHSYICNKPREISGLYYKTAAFPDILPLLFIRVTKWLAISVNFTDCTVISRIFTTE